MRQLVVFNHVSLDGYFVDRLGDMRWAYKDDAEWNAFVAGNTGDGAGGTLLFGRVTYEMMAAFWPTPLATRQAPAVAKHMNATTKVVFSRTLTQPSWENTRVLGGDLASDVTRLKSEAGGDIVVLGSGTLVSGLAQAGLVDEYQIIVNPLVLGDGRTLFEGVRDRFALRLLGTRAFTNGNVLLRYAA